MISGFGYFIEVIPNTFHLIWMGRRFPYVNRLAVESILLADPHCSVEIHFSDPPDNSHWRALQQLDRVSFRSIEIDELLMPWENAPAIRQTLDRVAQNYPAGRSNILRYLILYRWGGIYVDFDILMLRPFGSLLQERAVIGEELVFRADDERVQGAPFRLSMVPEYLSFLMSWGITRFNSRFCRDSKPLNRISKKLERIWATRKLNNAVLAAEPEHPFFRRAIEAIPKVDPAIRYALGPILMNQIWEQGWSSQEIRRLEPKAFYAIPPSQTHRFFSRSEKEQFSGAFLIHWCSSNEKKKAAALLPERLDREPTPSALLIHSLAWPTIFHRQQLTNRPLIDRL